MDGVTGANKTTLSATQLFERSVRSVAQPSDLTYHLVNDLPRLFKAEQGFAYRRTPAGGVQIIAAGSVAGVDRNSEMIGKLEARLSESPPTSPTAHRVGDVPGLSAMPFAILLPFGATLSSKFPDGVVLIRTQPWPAAMQEEAAYLAEVYGHAFERFSATRSLRWARFRRLLLLLCVLAATAALALVPAPLTVIAPARVIPEISFPAAPSIDGVVSDVYVEHAQQVQRGQELFRMRSDTAQAAVEQARAQLAVANATETKLRAEALRNPRARQELKVAQAETELAAIGLERAENALARHVVTAPITGLVVADKIASLEGAPLNFGDAPIQVVDPSRLVLQADVAVSDGALVYGLKSARVFFSQTPTQGDELTVLDLPFEPLEDRRGGVSYPMRFERPANDAEQSSAWILGNEGIVQLTGPERALGYVLFRRPIQWLAARVPW